MFSSDGAAAPYHVFARNFHAESAPLNRGVELAEEGREMEGA